MTAAGGGVHLLQAVNDEQLARLGTELDEAVDQLSVETYIATENGTDYRNGELDQALERADGVLVSVRSTTPMASAWFDAIRDQHPDLPVSLVVDDREPSTDARPGSGTDAIVACAIEHDVVDWFDAKFLERHPELVARRLIGGVDRHTDRTELPSLGTPIRAVVEGCPEAIAIVVDGRFVFANKATRDLLGAAGPEELLGEPVGSVLHPDEQGKLPGLGQQETDGIGRVEQTLLGLDGSIVQVELSVRPLDWDGGRGFLLTLHDVTNRVNQRRSLERRIDRFEQMLGHIDDTVVWMATADLSQLLYVSPGYENLWGSPVAPLYDNLEVVLEGVHPEDRDAIAQWMAQSRRQAERGEFQEADFDAEFRVCQTDEDIRWVESSGFPVHEDGEVTRWVGVLTDVTERKRRLEELSRFETVLESIEDPVWAVDDAGDLTLANHALCESVERPREELLGRSPRDLLVDDKGLTLERAEPILEGIEAVIRGENDRVQTEVRLPDREPPVVRDLRVVPIREEGEITGAIVVNRDVSARKRRAIALERSRRRYRTLIEQFPNGLVTLFDEDLRYQLVGGKGFEELEVSAEDLEGRRLDQVFPPDNVEIIEPFYRRALEGDSGKLELTLEGRVFRVQVVPVRDADGEVFAGMTVSQNVTEQKALERELDAARKRYRTLLQAAPDPIFVADPETGELIEANKAAADLLERPRENIIGLDQTALHPETGDDVYRQLFEEHVRDGGTKRWLPNGEQICALTQDGEQIPVEISVQTVELAEGAVIYGIFRDISRQVKTERALAELHDATREAMQAETRIEAARRIVSAMASAVDLPASAVYLFDDDAGALEPAAVSEEAEELMGSLPSFGPGEGIAWRVYATGESAFYDDVRTDHDVLNPDTPISSELVVPLGEHGVLLAGDPRPGRFGGRVRQLVEVLTASATAALDSVVQREQLRRRGQELQQQTQSLERVNHLNATIRGINRTLVEADDREAIMQAACDRLVDAEFIEFAWVAEPAPDHESLRPTAWEGAGRTYLDAIGVTGDDRPEPGEPTVDAATSGSVTVVQNIASDVRSGEWQTAALQQGFRSVLGIPIVYDGTKYGVLGVYTAERDGFNEADREVLVELGELLGLGLNAIDRRDALLGQRQTTVELLVEGPTSPDQPFAWLADRLGCQVEMDAVLPLNGQFLVYARFAGVVTSEVEDLVGTLPGFEHIRRVPDDEPPKMEPCLYEFSVDGSCVTTDIADRGGRPEAITFEESRGRVVAKLPATMDPSRLARALETAHPDLNLTVAEVQHETVDPSTVILLSNALTEAQHEALETAHAAGFFEWPRDSTSKEVATALGISQPAFSQRMRAALNKLVGAYAR